MGYLFRGVHDRTISDPAVYFGELGLVLEPKPMVDGVSRDGFPCKRLIALGEPFSGNVCVELNFVGHSIVRDDLHRKVRKRNRLVH